MTLGESSIDGPAFASITDSFEGVRFTTTLGWTGTDPQHHLNLLQSTDDPATGVTHFGHKLTLGETSFARPALVQFGSGIGGTAVAWAGTDAAHTLNVMRGAYGAQKTLTLWGETTNGAPALAFFNNGLVLAWTGTDANHSLNVLPLALGDLQPGTKTVLAQFSSSAGPNLSVFSNASTMELVLHWTTPTRHPNQAYSTDGVQCTSGLGAGGTPQLSASAPSSFYHQSEGAPAYWLAWTGTDPAHLLNLQWTAHFPQWPDPASTKTVLADAALGGPQIVFNSGFLLAWTGTDPGHSLNVAAFEGA